MGTEREGLDFGVADLRGGYVGGGWEEDPKSAGIKPALRFIVAGWDWFWF